MTDRKQLARLADLAAMVRDQRLEVLRVAAERKAATERLITGLEQPGTDALPIVAAARAELSYQVWAEQRRRELTQLLSTQNLECQKQRDAARLAFGRAQVLEQLKQIK